MLIIGLTGSLATGKSTVAAMFKERGARIIDADAITRDLLSPKGKCIKKVAKVFPDAILTVSYKINRSQLANIVFSNPRELKKLTDILYPEAFKEVKKQISKYRRDALVVLDVPLLFESGWDKITDTTIVVKASRKLQIKRAAQRLGLSKAEISRRLSNQMPIKAKCALADIIIDNRHSLQQTRKQVDAIIDRLLRRHPSGIQSRRWHG